jgi:hypothetical protein
VSRHPQVLPEGLCQCPDCAAMAAEVAAWRAIVDLENTLARARREWPGARRPEPSEADDVAPPVYRRSLLDVLADDA